MLLEPHDDLGPRELTPRKSIPLDKQGNTSRMGVSQRRTHIGVQAHSRLGSLPEGLALQPHHATAQLRHPVDGRLRHGNGMLLSCTTAVTPSRPDASGLLDRPPLCNCDFPS